MPPSAFQIGLPFAFAGERIHPRAMGKMPAGPAAAFSALPDHAFCGAACSARP